MSTSDNWANYYDATRNSPPRPLLVKALEYVKTKHSAIDIGAGSLKDARYLLSQGFEVTAIDQSPLLLTEVQKLSSVRLHPFVSTFAEFNFGIEQFDIASAMYALPFNPPTNFEEVFQRIKAALVHEGIFCGQFFGIHDSWATNKEMTFHSKEAIEKLLSDMQIIQLSEEEREGVTAIGTAKHWHIFEVIAKK